MTAKGTWGKVRSAPLRAGTMVVCPKCGGKHPLEEAHGEPQPMRYVTCGGIRAIAATGDHCVMGFRLEGA